MSGRWVSNKIEGTEMSVVKNKNGRGILLAMVHAIQQNKQLLGDVDGLSATATTA